MSPLDLDKLPVVRAAEFPITDDMNVGDIMTSNDANDAFAILTTQNAILHDALGALKKNRTRMRDDDFEVKRSKIVGMIQMRATARELVKARVDQLGLTKTPMKREQAFRLFSLFRKHEPDAFRRVVMIFNADPPEGLAPIQLEDEMSP